MLRLIFSSSQFHHSSRISSAIVASSKRFRIGLAGMPATMVYSIEYRKGICLYYFIRRPKYLNTLFLYSRYSCPNVAAMYFSSCNICKCSITTANAVNAAVSALKYISNTPYIHEIKPNKRRVAAELIYAAGDKLSLILVRYTRAPAVLHA